MCLYAIIQCSIGAALISNLSLFFAIRLYNIAIIKALLNGAINIIEKLFRIISFTEKLSNIKEHALCNILIIKKAPNVYRQFPKTSLKLFLIESTILFSSIINK